MKLFLTKYFFKNWDILSQTFLIPIKYSKISVNEILIEIWYNSDKQY